MSNESAAVAESEVTLEQILFSQENSDKTTFKAREFASERAEQVKELFLKAFLSEDAGALILDPEGTWVDQIKCAIQEGFTAGAQS